MADTAESALDILKSLGLLSDSSSNNSSGPLQDLGTSNGETTPNIMSPGFTSPDTTPVLNNPSISSSPEQSVSKLGSRINIDKLTSATSPDNRHPSNPYRSDDNTTVPKIADIGGAMKSSNQAFANEEETAKQSVTDQYLATKTRNEKVTAAQDQYVKDLAQADIQHQKDRDMAHKTSAAETAQWMQSMDKKAAEEPRSSRWWENTSGFGKVMWLLSLAVGTIGAAKEPGAKNVVADMMTHEIDKDVQKQKDRLNRQLDLGKLKGKMMQEDQKELLTDMSDDYTHKVGRINALLAANTVRANAASDPDLKASYSKIDEILQGEKTKIAIKRVDSATQERLKEAEERHADLRQSITLNHQTTEKVLDRQLARDLAQEKIDARLQAAEAKAKSKENEFEFSQQSGVSINTKDETGKPIVRNLTVPKDMVKEAHGIVSNGQKKVTTLAALRDAIDSDGLPYTLFSNSNESRQALAAAVDPQIKQMGGRFNAASAKALTDMILGEDPSSIIQRMKGGSKEDIVKLLDKEIQEAPGVIQQDLAAIPGTNIASDPNATLTFTPKETRGPKEHIMTGDEKIESATGKAPASVILKTPDDVKQFGQDAYKSLPKDIQHILDDTKAKFAEGHDKPIVTDIYNKASDALERWQKVHGNPGGAVVNNAYELLDDAKRQAGKITERLPEIKVMLQYNNPNGVTKKDVVELLEKNNITLSASQIQKMVNDANEAVKKRKGY